MECLPRETLKPFHRGEAYSSGVSEKKEEKILWVLCVSSSADCGTGGEKYALTFPHSNAWIFSQAEGLRGELMSTSRMVYSTDSGRICSGCRQPVSKCICKKKKGEKKQPAHPGDGVIRIRREVKGRKGKTVTAILGIPLDDKELKQFVKILKRRCGTGGTVKDGMVIIQGDHRKTLLKEIEKQGYTAKLAGG